MIALLLLVGLLFLGYWYELDFLCGFLEEEE